MASIFKSHSVAPGNARSSSPSAEPLPWESAVERAKEYVEAVRVQVQMMLDECSKECDQLRDKARQEGLSEAHAEIERLAASRAEEIATTRIQDATDTIHTVCEQLENATRTWLHEWQHETVAIAISIAEKLMARQMETDPTIVLRWIEEAVHSIQSQSRITVRLHPQEAMQLTEAIPELLARTAPGIELQILEDHSVGRHGVILQSAEATIDRSMAVQLKRLEQELR